MNQRATIALAAAWTLLSLPSICWAATRAIGVGLSLTSLSLVAALLFAVQTLRTRTDAWTLPTRRGVIALAACAMCIVVHERWLALQSLSFIACVVGALVIAGACDQKRQLAALLLVVSLPFVGHLETYFGFPVRAATADLVAFVLRAAGVVAATGDSVIVLENGIADVAEACSGLKTLSTGALGLVWAVALQPRPVRASRAVIVAGSALVGLLAANVARVLCIVALEHVLHAPELAKVAHTPLGIFSFVVICGAAFMVLARMPPVTVSTAASIPRVGPRPALITAAALSALVVLRPALAPAHVAELPLPVEAVLVGGTPRSLDDKERTLFQSHRARAFKWETQDRGRRAWVMIVVSDSFRAHHAPEVCTVAHGHRVDRLRKELVLAELSATTYSIDGDAQRALYWLESATETTDSVLARSLDTKAQRWALVSIVIAGGDLPSADLLQTARTTALSLVRPIDARGDEETALYRPAHQFSVWPARYASSSTEGPNYGTEN